MLNIFLTTIFALIATFCAGQEGNRTVYKAYVDPVTKVRSVSIPAGYSLAIHKYINKERLRFQIPVPTPDSIIIENDGVTFMYCGKAGDGKFNFVSRFIEIPTRQGMPKTFKVARGTLFFTTK